MAGSTERLRQKLGQPKELPTSAEFVEELFLLAGGPRELARMVFKELKSPTAGPLMKARVFELMLRSLKEMEEKTDPDRQIGEMSDDELVRFLKANAKGLLED